MANVMPANGIMKNVAIIKMGNDQIQMPVNNPNKRMCCIFIEMF